MIFRNRKLLGLPVCIPEINSEGRFEVEEAHPVASWLRFLSSDPVAFDFHYTRDDRHVILSGAHSGGKTELLKNVGLYHLIGLAGFPLPARRAVIPVTDKIQTSFSKAAEKGKGSLESEIWETVRTARDLGPNDLWLLDEFLDTTKPELAGHLETPLLQIIRRTPGAVLLVSHRAASMEDDLGFRFMHPELEEKELAVYESVYVDDELYGGGHYSTPTDRKERRLVPTHRFVEGRPDGRLTQRHAMEMWRDARAGNKIQHSAIIMPKHTSSRRRERERRHEDTGRWSQHDDLD